MDDIIFYIPEKFGMLPGDYYKRNPKVYKLFSICHFIFTLGVSIQPAYLIATIVYVEEDQPTKIFFTLIFFLLSLQSMICVTPVGYNNILYPEEYSQMKQHFRLIDVLLKKREIYVDNKWKIFKFIIFHVYYLFMNTLYTRSAWDRYSNIYNVMVLWPMYVWYLQVPIAWTVLEAVRKRLKILNEYIAQIYPKEMGFIKVSTSKAIISFDNQYPFDIIELLDIYDKITKIIRTYNKMFGMFSSVLAFLVIIEYVSNVFRLVTFEDDPDIETAILDVFTMITHTVSSTNVYIRMCF